MNSLVLIAFLICSGAHAAQNVNVSTATAGAQQAPAWKKWFQTLKKGLESSPVERYTQSAGRSITAVAAVRGEKQKSSGAQKVYWKGRQSQAQQKALQKEKEEFTAAVNLVLEGKTDSAVQKLEEFKKAHPKSSLMPDVEEALQRLSETQPAPAPAPEN